MLSDIGKPEDTAPGMAHKIKFFLAEPFKQQFEMCIRDRDRETRQAASLPTGRHP